MSAVAQAVETYCRETRRYADLANTSEATYYPLVRNLISAVLDERGLPFEVRMGTNEHRPSGGHDAPDFILSDSGLLVSVLGEIKNPGDEIEDIAKSEDRNDQIGRYLAQTGVVLVSNVRSLGLLTCKPKFDRTKSARVPPSARELLLKVPLWSNGRAFSQQDLARIGEIIERSVLDFAPIAEPASLARILAHQAKDAKAGLPSNLKSVQPLLDDYKEALGLTFEVDDEKGDAFFRSTLIQTVFYGLFAGWALWQRANDGARFEWHHIDQYLRMPFLGGLFHEFRHPTRLKQLRLEHHLDRATATLQRVDLKLFASRMIFPTVEDKDVATVAMTYFYEPFLEAFDPDLKKTLGVWYTPPEIVRYQVQRAHQLLKSELKCPRGLADDQVVFLDPCCGTGAYLLEVSRCIARELREAGEGTHIGLALLRALTTRVLGFEILTAPFVIAQLQLFVLLSELGAPPPNEQRLRVHLTNALTGWRERKQLRLNFPDLQAEYDEAQALKHEAPIIVVMGNPPYDRFAGVAIDDEADLLDHYKGIHRRTKKRADGSTVMEQDGPSELYTRFGVRKQLLEDRYVRFFRMAEERIGENSEIGLVSMISNSSWLTGRSHPLMRESLLGSFHEVWIDNLNGDKYRTGKVIPRGLPGAGTADQSVFSTDLDARGIQTGTAITTFLKRNAKRTPPGKTRVHYRDFWGRADEKRAGLLASVSTGNGVDFPQYQRIQPTEQGRWRLSPQQNAAGYDAWPSIDDLFPAKFQGVNPNRGITGSVIDTDRDALAKRMRRYYEAKQFQDVADRYPTLATKRAGYDPAKVWKALKRAGPFRGKRIRPYLLFPMDQRWIFYESGHKLLNRARPEFWEQIEENLFLVTVPEPRKVSEAKPLVSSTLVDLHVHDRGSVCIPARIHGGRVGGKSIANLPPVAWRVLRKAWHGSGELNSAHARKSAIRLFYCALAVLHAPAYGEEHKSALAADWARLPIPRDPTTFARLARVGNDVAVLLDPTKDANLVIRRVLGKESADRIGVFRRVDGGNIRADDLRIAVSYFGSAKGRYVLRENETLLGEPVGNLFINDHAYFADVPQSAWQLELGGYPVLRKWLGYRQFDRNDSRPLSLADQGVFRSIVKRLSALVLLGSELDDLYAAASADAFSAEELGIG